MPPVGARSLFSPIRLRELVLPNRIVIPPMCQYSAVDGCAADWHVIHLGGLSLSGAGLIIIEATAVEPEGRITPDCLGLWSDETEAALGRVLTMVRRYSNIPIGIQLGHAGRKASSSAPRQGKRPLEPQDGGWLTLAPSARPVTAGGPMPRALNGDEMDRIAESFAQSARRADRLGLDLLEIHAAHGFLLSSFLSPLANMRADEFGGSLDNRMRFPLRVFDAVRAAWPEAKPIGVRLNGTDWDPGGITVEDAVAFARALREHGCDFVDVSSGGNSNVRVPTAPLYQLPFATEIRQKAGIPVVAVGLISNAEEADRLVASGSADMVGIGRAMLNDPHWPWRAAQLLNAEVQIPHQYARAASLPGRAG
jgi:2,4-dienoyl-CoA reductase-like NADH-dependent reductase (Old Yellow Enzyme family)